ncbi:MAG TPA: metal-dependent hydrolase [Kiritimatiellia bacterium]|nr:metal-dependent hydrolase [Kiritimatiellia bacterium]
MSSPVGHSVIGAAFGVLYFLKPAGRRGLWVQAAEKWPWILGAALFANLPDIDYIPGVMAGELNLYHHGVTHTLGWAALVSLLVWIPLRPKGARGRELSLIFLLLFSHLALDWVTADGKEPYGIMILWPFSNNYFISEVPLLPHLRKADFTELLDPYNFRIMAVEILRTLPVLLLALACKLFGGRRGAPPL